MKKTILIFLLGAGLVLTGCVKQTPAQNQNLNQPVANQNQNVNQNANQPAVNANQPADPTADWKTYQDTNLGVSFSFKYPSTWTYQKFSCNIAGVAFCPLTGHSPSKCGQTCGMDSPLSPIYLYPYEGQPALTESDTLKYWGEPNISLDLLDGKYREVYANVISTFRYAK